MHVLSLTDSKTALEGLREAIRAGNTRVIHLLVWIGLHDNLDLRWLFWTFRNAGGRLRKGRLATVYEVFRLVLRNISTGDVTRIRQGIIDFRDEAVHSRDQAMIDLAVDVEDPILGDLVEIEDVDDTQLSRYED